MTQPNQTGGGQDAQVVNIMDYLPPSAATLGQAYAATATAPAKFYDQDQDVQVERSPAPVDAPPAGAGLAAPVSGEIVAHHGRHLPELPAWARRGELGKFASEAKLVAGAHVRFHLAMTPVYVLRAPVGYVRILRAWGHWYGGDYGHLIRASRRDRRAATDRKARKDAHAQVKQYKVERREHRLRAAGLTLGGLVGAGVAVTLIVSSGGLLAALGLGVGAVTLGSVTGRPRAKDGTPIELPGPRQAMLGQDTIVQALIDAKVISEAQRDAVRLLEPVHKDGSGLTTIIELPAGMPGEVLIKNRVAFAAARRIHRSRLVLEQMRGDDYHEGAVRMWEGPFDPFARTYRSPLVKLKGALDTWGEGAPVGVSGLTRPLVRRLRDRSIVVGGAPRAGKTEWMIGLIAAALLDPTMDVRGADGKGAADYHRLAPLCHTFFKRDAERFALLLSLVLEEMERTYDVLSEMGKSKVDDEVLRTGRVRRMLLFVDEWRFYAGNKKFGQVIIERTATLCALAPAAGIIVVIGAQRPAADILPGEVADVMTDRVAFRVDDTAASNIILGPGKASAGWDASKIPGGDANRGTGIMDVDGEDTIQIKGHHLPEEDQVMVMATARRVRAEAGAMPGQREDLIEADLLELTGVSSAGGGANHGRTAGGPAAQGPAASEFDQALIPTISTILHAFEQEQAEFLATAVLAEYLHREDPEAWPAERIANASLLGRDLQKVLNKELAAAGLAIEDEPLASDRQNQVRGYSRAQFEAYGLALE